MKNLAIEDEIYSFIKRVICVAFLSIYVHVLIFDLLGVDFSACCSEHEFSKPSSLNKKRGVGFFPHTHVVYVAPKSRFTGTVFV